MSQLLAVILILLGGAFIAVGLVSKQRAKAAAAWPTVPGTILKTELVRHVTRNKGVSSTSYEPVVAYRYTVMGQEYTAKRLAFGSTRVKDDQGQAILAKYPEGAQVPVYYNPAKPSEALLELSAMGTGVQLITGIVCAALGLVLLMISLL